MLIKLQYRFNFFRRVFILVFLVASQNLGAVKSISFLHYGATEGLPDNRVNAIVQDQAGFVWIGTSGGLCRFDGHEFLSYFFDQNNSNSVCGNYIKDLELQSDGTLWIATGDGGLCSLSPDRKFFRRYESGSMYKTSYNVNCIEMTADEKFLYIGMENGGLHMLNVTTGAVVQALPDTEPNSGSVYDILALPSGEVYYSQSAFGFRRLVNGRVEKSPVNMSYPHPAHTISCFFSDSQNRMWMGAWSDRLFRQENFTSPLIEYSMYGNQMPNLSGNEILTIDESADKRLWLGTKLDGLFLFDPATGLFTHYDSNRANPHALRGNTVFCIFRDRDNRMWVGTDEGLNIYDPAINRFSVNYLSYENDCQVYCFLSESDSLFIGTEKGLYIKSGNGSLTHYKIDRFYQGEEVRSLFRDSNQRLWIGTQHGIYFWNNKSKNIERIPNAVNPVINHTNITSSYVTRVIEYPFQGKMAIWAFVLGHGVLIFPDDKVSYAFLPKAGTSVENLVRNVYVDSQNRLWVTGSVLGASIVLPFSGTPNPYQAIPLEIQPVASVNLGVKNGFDVVDFSGKYWLSSRGRGLLNMPLDPNEKPEVIPDFPLRNVYGINTDKSGNIWFLSALGIGRYVPQNKSLRFFDERSGVPTDGLSGLLYKGSNGNIYCGGNGFFISFEPEKITSQSKNPITRLTHLVVMDEPSDSLLFSKNFKLDHDRNTLRIAVSSLNFTNPSMDEYLYKLEGLYEEWISNGTNNIIAFTGLPPGDYVLSVVTRNSEGVTSEVPATLAFTISPPFYNTWFFYLLMAALVGLIGYAFYRNRVRQLMAIMNMRDKIARDLHDDVGSTLGSISIYSEAIKQQMKGKMSDFSASTLEKIGVSSRLMIEQMSDIVWSVDPQRDTMEHLVERMQNFGSDLFAATDISFNLEVDKGSFSKKLDMEARKSIFLIFKEALYNSLKYSGGSAVNVKMTSSGGKITLVISDNGKGFNPDNAASYNGNGLRNMMFRAKNINADLQIKSEDGWGTDVILVIS